LNGAYWADGGLVSTAKECIIFLKALNEGRIIDGDVRVDAQLALTAVSTSIWLWNNVPRTTLVH
jgi:hypothetical protein